MTPGPRRPPPMGCDRPASAAEAVGLEPTSDSSPPPVFETGSSSRRMASVFVRFAGVGFEPTSKRSERSILPLDDPAVPSYRTSERAHVPFSDFKPHRFDPSSHARLRRRPSAAATEHLDRRRTNRRNLARRRRACRTRSLGNGAAVPSRKRCFCFFLAARSSIRGPATCSAKSAEAIPGNPRVTSHQPAGLTPAARPWVAAGPHDSSPDARPALRSTLPAIFPQRPRASAPQAPRACTRESSSTT